MKKRHLVLSCISLALAGNALAATPVEYDVFTKQDVEVSAKIFTMYHNDSEALVKKYDQKDLRQMDAMLKQIHARQAYIEVNATDVIAKNVKCRREANDWFPTYTEEQCKEYSGKVFEITNELRIINEATDNLGKARAKFIFNKDAQLQRKITQQAERQRKAEDVRLAKEKAARVAKQEAERKAAIEAKIAAREAQKQAKEQKYKAREEMLAHLKSGMTKEEITQRIVEVRSEWKKYCTTRGVNYTTDAFSDAKMMQREYNRMVNSYRIELLGDGYLKADALDIAVDTYAHFKKDVDSTITSANQRKYSIINDCLSDREFWKF